MGWKKGWATTPTPPVFSSNTRSVRHLSAKASTGPNDRPSLRNTEITGRIPQCPHRSSQQTCRAAAAELTTPTAESGFNGDRNVTLLAPTSLSRCRQLCMRACCRRRAADVCTVGTAVKPADLPENSPGWKVTGCYWGKKKMRQSNEWNANYAFKGR